ncbi:hypothetical protein [Streptomyces sp. WAC06614]|uniref:hypothetical protein n=1 Tax=Streptomyces sp. WAC06614 TaxID=2487416 RepID=UPI000F7A3F37|nr:hypothetical protein [Streptomyces sp. WAC06614]RSS66694.1 hypothetical protein EF918_29410 [Streptomyces sp. WAC06614]
MHHAPIVVHRISPSGGRRVTLLVSGHEDILGLAYSDADVIEFLRRAEVPDPDEVVLGDSPLVDWVGGEPHVYAQEPSDTDIP